MSGRPLSRPGRGGTPAPGTPGAGRASLLLSVAAWLLCAPSGASAQSRRPFWTEKESYVEDSWLYAVGVAQAPGRDKGRVEALESGRQAIGDFVQLADLGRIKVETLREYVEDQGDAGVDVYVLLRTAYAPLMRFKRAQDADALRRLTEFQKQQESTLKAMKEQKEKADKTRAEAAGLQLELAALLREIDKVSQGAVENVRLGMTEVEVSRLVGPAVLRERCGTDSALNYRKSWILFKSGVAACRVPTDQYNSPCMACSSWGAAPLR